jgi:ubiquinone/menaquinone biosynthesis C-methylase UbiE
LDSGELLRKLRLKFDKQFSSGWDKKVRAMRHYDRVARVYDVQYAEEQDAKIMTALNCVNLKEKSLVLDVGCGTGFLFQHFGNSVRLLVGLDFSFGMLKEAKNRAKHSLMISLIRADADFLPFKSQVFDAVFALTVLQNMPNALMTLHESKRVSKTGSTLVITGFKKFRTYRYFHPSTFSRLLEDTGLKVCNIIDDDKLKDYIAICRLDSA